MGCYHEANPFTGRIPKQGRLVAIGVNNPASELLPPYEPRELEGIQVQPLVVREHMRPVGQIVIGDCPDPGVNNVDIVTTSSHHAG